MVSSLEWKWLNYKTHFSFISKTSFEQTVVRACNRAFVFTNTSKDFGLNEVHKKRFLKDAIDIMKRSETNRRFK